MSDYVIVFALLGWLALALVTVAVVACVGRAGHHEDIQRGMSSDVNPAAQTRTWAGVRQAS